MMIMIDDVMMMTMIMMMMMMTNFTAVVEEGATLPLLWNPSTPDNVDQGHD
jgi:hypothetical protein